MPTSHRQSEDVTVYEKSSQPVRTGSLIIWVQYASRSHGKVSYGVGRVGLPSAYQVDAEVGSSVYFETPDAGTFEIRVMRIFESDSDGAADFLVSGITPMPGILGGFAEGDPSNAPFSDEERERVEQSIEELRAEIRAKVDLKSAQLELLDSKLDQVRASIAVLGRRDWTWLLIGCLTSFTASAALESSVAKQLFQAASSAFSWLVSSTVRLIVG